MKLEPDAQGRAVETIDTLGLRAGIVYYPSGQVQYSGTLKATAAPKWYAATDTASYFATQDGHTLRSLYEYDLTNSLPTDAVSYDKVTDALGHVTRTYQDAAGRAIQTTYNDGSLTQTLYGMGVNAVSGHTVSGQTITGHQETRIDQRGVATDYFYDATGQLTDVYLPAVADALNGNTMTRPHWHYTYDANGNQLAQTDPKTHTTSFAYDEQNRRVGRTLPGTETENWIFELPADGTYPNRFGRLVAHVDFKGQTTAYEYDTGVNQGRVKKEYRFGSTVSALNANQSIITANAAEHTEYFYDGLGRRFQVDAYSGATRTRRETYTFDVLTGQVSQIVSPEGTIHYEYDPATGRHTRTYTNYNDTTYIYDTQGRLWKVHVTKLNNGTVDQWTIYGYDAVGNLYTVTQPNGITTTYTYDGLNRLDLEEVKNSSNATIASYDYHARDDGLRDYVVEHQKETSGSFSDVKISYGYDDNGRLISELRDGYSTGKSLSTNGLPNDAGDYLDTYSFDLAGNRTTRGHDETGTSSDQSIAYTYNVDDQLLTETATGANAYTTTNGHTTSGTFYKGYDANGSLVEENRTGYQAKTATYSWDLRNRMVSSTISGTTTAFGYDSNGTRISEGSGGSTTYYVNDAINPTGYSKAVEEKSSLTAVPTRSYVLGLKVEGQSDATNGTLYLLTDGRSSTRALIDLSGINQEREDYDIFGRRLGTGAAKTLWLFGGDGVYDSPTGWTYHLARWREDFRFVSYDSFEADPEAPASLHKYVLLNSNPTNFIDPSGMYTQGMGYAAEAAIEIVYRADHPGNAVSYGGWTGLGLPTGPAFRLKPDIFNTTTSRWAEIKPLSPSGIAKAVLKGGVYTAAFLPFGYLPDVFWTPSTHLAVAGTMPIVFFNVGGIIFYSDATDLAEDLIALTTIAAVRSFMTSQLGQRLATSAVEVLGDLIPGLAGARVPADAARFGDHLGIAVLLGVLGFI